MIGAISGFVALGTCCCQFVVDLVRLQGASVGCPVFRQGFAGQAVANFEWNGASRGRAHTDGIASLLFSDAPEGAISGDIWGAIMFSQRVIHRFSRDGQNVKSRAQTAAALAAGDASQTIGDVRASPLPTPSRHRDQLT